MANEKEVRYPEARLELERVELKDEGMNVPGQTAEQYPSREKVLFSADTQPGNRLRSRQQYNLWLTPDRLFLVVEHPASKLREMVPIGNVAQFRVAATK